MVSPLPSFISRGILEQERKFAELSKQGRRGYETPRDGERPPLQPAMRTFSDAQTKQVLNIEKPHLEHRLSNPMEEWRGEPNLPPPRSRPLPPEPSTSLENTRRLRNGKKEHVTLVP